MAASLALYKSAQIILTYTAYLSRVAIRHQTVSQPLLQMFSDLKLQIVCFKRDKPAESVFAFSDLALGGC